MANRSSTARVIGAGVIGNLLEWYDFAIYGFFAAQIGHAFFPVEDKVAQILSAFGIFAIGYVMRPLGGLVTGYIGDCFGRRAALTFSVAAMAVPTFLVGVLPDYHTLGIMAPVLLTLLRVVQGLSVGGEYTTAMVFLVERAPAGRRGLMGAICSSGADLGALLGSATGTVLAASMSAEDLAAWGWRLPFLLGLFVGLAGFALRRGLEEIPVSVDGQPAMVAAVRHELPLLLRLCGLSVFLAVGYYLMFLYIVSWLQTADGIAPDHALAINTVSILGLLFACLFAGWLSDHIGRRKVMLLGMAGAGRRLAAVLAAPSPKHDGDPGRTVRLRADRRPLRRNASRRAGRGDTAPGALHGGGAGLQHPARHHRRPHPDGGDLAGRAHRR